MKSKSSERPGWVTGSIVVLVFLAAGCGSKAKTATSTTAAVLTVGAYERQQACYAGKLFFDNEGNCYSADPTSLSAADREKIRVPAPAASAPAKPVAPAAAPVAPVAPAPVAPAPVAPAAPKPVTPSSAVPVAPSAAKPASSTASTPPKPAASSSSTTQAAAQLPTVNDGTITNWQLQVQSNKGNPPSALQGQVPLAFAVKAGEVSAGQSFDPNSEMFSSTVGSIDVNSQAFLKVQFTQGGILRSGVSLNGELGGAGGGLSISGTYKYTNAEDTTKTDTGTFTLTRQ